MFKVSADKAKNLLVMTFAKHVAPEELKDARSTVKTLVADLPSGFRLLSDFSSLDTMDPACLVQIRENMDLFNQRGIAVVVRVIPDPHKDIGLNILSLFHYRRGVRIVTCARLPEAMDALKV